MNKDHILRSLIFALFYFILPHDTMSRSVEVLKMESISSVVGRLTHNKMSPPLTLCKCVHHSLGLLSTNIKRHSNARCQDKDVFNSPPSLTRKYIILRVKRHRGNT